MSWFTVLRLLLLQKRSWMTQHFYQAKMLPSNDSFHKSLLFSKSFKVFHCSVINVLLLSSAVSLSDSLFIIAPLSSFVNNFFHLFQKSFWGLPPRSLLLLFLFRFGACRLISDSFVILSCPASFVNSFFAFILQYNQKSPITAQKLIIYKCLLHIQILSERISLSNSHDFLRRKNCYSFCNSGKTFI